MLIGCLEQLQIYVLCHRSGVPGYEAPGGPLQHFLCLQPLQDQQAHPQLCRQLRAVGRHHAADQHHFLHWPSGRYVFHLKNFFFIYSILFYFFRVFCAQHV